MKWLGKNRSGAGALVLLALLAMVLVRPAFTAPPVTEVWTRVYASPGSGPDEAVVAAVDGSGNLYVTGQTWGGSSTNVDYLTLSYDRAGNVRWAQRYNGPGSQLDLPSAMAVDDSGNVYVTGYSVGEGTQHDFATISYDRDGNQRWLQRYSGPGEAFDGARSIAVDGAGNCYVTGDSIGASGTNDFITISYDPDGNFRWLREYSGDGNEFDAGIKVAVDGMGNVYVAGTSIGIGTNGDYATVSYDTNGNLRWVRRYNGPANSYDYVRDFGLDPAGNVYVTGLSNGTTGEDYATVSYDADGNFRWAQRYNSTGNVNDQPTALVVDAQGNVSVTGNGFTGTTSFSDYATVSYNSAGELRWTQRYNGPASSGDLANALAVDGDGNVYVTGASGGGSFFSDYATVSYDRTGQQRWVQRLNGPGNHQDVATAVAVDDSGNVYVSGSSTAFSTGKDFFTVRYAQNQAPVAVNDSYTVLWGREFHSDQNPALEAYQTGVLGNDLDADGDSLTATLQSGPQHGSLLAFNANGSFTYAPNAGYVGPDQFTYWAGDGALPSGLATVSLTVANHAPVAVDQPVTTPEDAAVAVNLEASDPDGDSLTYSVAVGPAHGSLSGSGSGASRTYTPAANYSGPDSFTFRAHDGAADSNLATVNLSVSAVNDPPIASDQSLSTPEDTAVDLLLAGADVDGDALTYAVTSGPAHGTLSGAGASRTYTPNPNYYGPDSFTFQVNDGPADSSAATVSLTVTAVNDAPTAADQTVSTPEDIPKEIVLVAADVESDALTYTIKTGPAHGVLSGAGASRTYTPTENYSGPDSFTYQVNDGLADSNVAMVSLTVTPVNDPPVAADQALTTPEDTPKEITLTASDAEGDALTYRLVAGPSHGTLSGGGATHTYTPEANYFGPDSFTFRVSDGQAEGPAGTLSLTVTPVNDAPVAAAQALTTPEDTPKTLTLTATDAESDPLAFTVVGGPLHGALSGTVPNLTYTPAANYSGPDSLVFKSSDGQADSSEAVVTLTITPVNDAPVASSLSLSTPEDTPRSLTLAATDVEGSPLTYTVLASPAHGTLTGSGASRTYTPAAHFNGQDSFTYRASDGQANSNTAVVFVTMTPVNDAPVAVADSYTVAEDSTLTVPAPGVLANDSDVEGSPLTAELTSPALGTLVFNLNGSFTYTPVADYHGPDSFSYRTSDGTAQSASTQVTLTVTPVNDPPSATMGSATLPEDTPTALTLVGSDPDGDALTYTVVSPPTHGALTGAGAMRTYTPVLNYHGPDQFTFRVSDGVVNSAPVPVTLTITPVNDAPAASTDAYTVNKNLPLNVTAPGVLGNDTDAEGDPLTAGSPTGPAHGTLLLQSDGGFTYQPAPNFSGEDTFTYRPSDGQQAGTPTTVRITVGADNNPPASVSGTGATDEEVPLNLTLTGTDPDGDTLTYSVLTPPVHGTLTGTGAARTYTPQENYSGPDSVRFQVSDGQASSAAATVALTVRPVNDPPVAHAGSDQTLEATGAVTPVNLSGSGSTDVEGDALTYRWTRNGETVGNAAQLTLALPVGQHTLELTATDPSGAAGTDAVLVTVRDTTVPTLTLPADLAVPQNAPTGARVTFAVTAADAVSTVTVVSTPASGSLFPLGPTTVNVTATDAAGNQKLGTFRVTVGVPSSTAGKVTASGAILVGGKKASLALTVTQKPGRPLKGNLKFTDPGSRQTLKSTRINALVITGTRAQIFGQGTVARGVTVSFLAEAEDLGTAAGSDRFRLELSDGRVFGAAVLSSGKVKITR